MCMVPSSTTFSTALGPKKASHLAEQSSGKYKANDQR
eukprot:CAMPEP_0204068644 /NCGR_PEP_ID=MMETSP0360-20130528/155637_1 /ASSEMBLY_ACC=CAM_ASM_000342 /TAXON_ID=268821 /ORGANISM="Scrippsiella Hangoei, Strain SHTV-5" /LENGTH=36 /DNA_ID= /DNA_START= /DNA_END= /DNA_ORIENTATION=